MSYPFGYILKFFYLPNISIPTSAPPFAGRTQVGISRLFYSAVSAGYFAPISTLTL